MERDHTVTIKIYPGTRAELLLHPATAAALGLGSRKFACLSFGSQKQSASLRPNGALAQDEVWLSAQLSQGLHLPDYPLYELRAVQGELRVGPHIGLLVSEDDRKLTASRLKKMLSYAKAYDRLHGALVVFALDQIDQEHRLITGYGYNPAQRCWQRGIFPYPAALYRTIGLNSAWKNHFLSAIGDKMFNSRFFSKWDMYQWFSGDAELNPHLPVTVPYGSPQDVLAMLARFPVVYIKPVSGLRGRGIVRMSAANPGFSCEYRANRKNRRIPLADWAQACAYLERRFHSGKYLIQQAVDLLEYQGGIIDFRCVLQKDQAGAWVCQAIVGRSGAKGSIVSNISSGGAAFPAADILQRALATSLETIAQQQNEMAAFAIRVCHKLDGYGIHCGTLGLDVGLDSQGKLWLIEINNRDPDPTIALDIQDAELYDRLKTGPLFYAKFLAGFPATDGPETGSV